MADICDLGCILTSWGILKAISSSWLFLEHRWTTKHGENAASSTRWKTKCWNRVCLRAEAVSDSQAVSLSCLTANHTRLAVPDRSTCSGTLEILRESKNGICDTTYIFCFWELEAKIWFTTTWVVYLEAYQCSHHYFEYFHAFGRYFHHEQGLAN